MHIGEHSYMNKLKGFHSVLLYYILYFSYSLPYETISMCIFKPYFVFFDSKPYAPIFAVCLTNLTLNFDFTSNHFHSLQLPLNDNVSHHLTLSNTSRPFQQKSLNFHLDSSSMIKYVFMMHINLVCVLMLLPTMFNVYNIDQQTF